MTMILLDTETTGVSPERDQIIELCIQFGLDGEQRTRRFRPTTPIPAEATAVHGITDADVLECPSFAACARSIADILNAATVIVGYNVRFDLDMIQAELARAGLPPIDLTAKQIIDPLQLWRHFEPRTLAAAHLRFAGSEHTAAHSAASDTAATARVLTGMMRHWGLTLEQAAPLADPMPDRHQWVGPSNHIQRSDGRVVFAFGKHRGVPVTAVDQGFLSWVIDKDFPVHVKAICAEAKRLPCDEFEAWIDTRYPRKETAQ